MQGNQIEFDTDDLYIDGQRSCHRERAVGDPLRGRSGVSPREMKLVIMNAGQREAHPCLRRWRC